MLPFLFSRIRKGFFIFLPLALLGGYAVHDAFSHYYGSDIAGYAEIGGCNFGSTSETPCHGSVSPSTSIHFSTPSPIVAGNTYLFTVTISNPDTADHYAGLDVDVDTPVVLDSIAGMNTFLTPPFAGVSDEYSITHNTPKMLVGDSATWSFWYTAPTTPGVYPIYIDGNTVNGDSATADTEDHWDSITDFINVVPSDGVTPSSFASAIQVYPNPASNELFINDGIPSDEGSYALIDPSGRVVLNGGEIPLDGRHSANISSIAAGTYILSVQPQIGRAFSRSVVIRR
jgi:hypothetical protein